MSEPDALLDALAGEGEWQRQRTLDALVRDGLPAPAVRELAGRLGDPDATRRASARMALAALAAPSSSSHADAQATLSAALSADAENVRVLAASALGEAGDAAAGPALIDALSDPSPNVAAAAADALGALRFAPALDALAEVGASASYWVRAAAVVALGRLEDERGVPALDRIARDPGLEEAVAEALARINHPSALPVLERVHGAAPEPALHAAGRILAAHPRVEPPAWVVEGARQIEASLRRTFLEDDDASTDDPASARLLGLTGSPESAELLVELACAPRRSEAAIAGLLAVPPELRADAILGQLENADDQDLTSLLPLLPPLDDPARTRRLVPLLGHASAEVRAAAAEVLARADPPEALSLLTSALETEGVTPEVVRAAGALGDVACASLLPLLRDPSPAVRAAAASGLTRCATPAVEAELRAALEEESDPEAWDALVRALARSAGSRAMDVLDEALESPRPGARLSAIEALSATGDPAAIPRLRRAMERSQPERVAALRSLGALGLPEAAPLLTAPLAAADLEERQAAALSATLLAGAVEPAAAERMARDEDGWIRTCAARVLAAHGGAGRRLLEELARSDPDREVRSVARRGLDEVA